MKMIPVAIIGAMLAEIAGFVWVGRYTGALFVILWVIASAVAGSMLIRQQGRRAAASLRDLMNGLGPAGSSKAEMLLVVAGVLLIIPGFFTDAAGLLLLLPPVRRWIAAHALRRFGRTTVVRGGTLIEGEAHVVRDDDIDILPPRNSRS